jgi:hypothetical protein
MTLDIVEWLREPGRYSGIQCDGCVKAADEIERLRAEVELWKDRYHAEREDHDATIKHCDRVLNEWEA